MLVLVYVRSSLSHELIACHKPAFYCGQVHDAADKVLRKVVGLGSHFILGLCLTVDFVQ